MPTIQLRPTFPARVRGLSERRATAVPRGFARMPVYVAKAEGAVA